MAHTPATFLDAQTFEQALSVLDRARPSPREDRLFQLLSWMVWIAVAATAAFLLLRATVFEEGEIPWLLWPILGIYLVIVPLFFSNWPLVAKLWRAARYRRRLAPSFRSRLLGHFRTQRRRRRLSHLATLILSVLGGIVAVLALPGLILFAGDPTGQGVFAVATVFGLSCVFLHFMARGRERLRAIADLRASLIASRARPDGLKAADYDEIARIERAQIADDRRRSVTTVSDETLERTFGTKEHRAVREARMALPPETLARVRICIDLLTSRPREVPAEQRGDISYLRVPDTTLELGFTVDWEAREIRLLSLKPATDTSSSTTRNDEA